MEWAVLFEFLGLETLRSGLDPFAGGCGGVASAGCGRSGMQGFHERQSFEELLIVHACGHLSPREAPSPEEVGEGRILARPPRTGGERLR